MFKDADYWRARIGEPICGYYDGKIGVLQDVRSEKNDVDIFVSGHWHNSVWCSFDTDKERWLHPDLLPENSKRIEELEAANKWQREHTEALDKNWSALNDMNLNAIRKALDVSQDTSIPEMVYIIKYLVEVNQKYKQEALESLRKNAMSDEEIERLLD